MEALRCHSSRKQTDCSGYAGLGSKREDTAKQSQLPIRARYPTTWFTGKMLIVGSIPKLTKLRILFYFLILSVWNSHCWQRSVFKASRSDKLELHALLYCFQTVSKQWGLRAQTQKTARLRDSSANCTKQQHIDLGHWKPRLTRIHANNTMMIHYCLL